MFWGLGPCDVMILLLEKTTEISKALLCILTWFDSIMRVGEQVLLRPFYIWVNSGSELNLPKMKIFSAWGLNRDRSVDWCLSCIWESFGYHYIRYFFTSDLFSPLIFQLCVCYLLKLLHSSSIFSSVSLFYCFFSLYLCFESFCGVIFKFSKAALNLNMRLLKSLFLLQFY